jgi:hypothetical protein
MRVAAVLMAGDTQEKWLHQLPDTGDDMPHRVSLTFRSIVPGFEDRLGATTSSDCKRNGATTLHA